jgi:Cytidylate kinase-like family
MGVITISKEALTDSEKIASLLARRLGWQYVGKHLFSRIAKELNISQNAIDMGNFSLREAVSFIKKS